MQFPGTARRIAVLLAASALMASPAAITASASASTRHTGWIRMAHLSPDTPAMDVYLYSFGDASARIVLRHIAYGTVSTYEAVTAGDYSLAMRPAGASPGSQPVLSGSVMIKSGRAYTAAAVGPRTALRLQVIGDDLTTPPGKALVRVVQASLKHQAVTVRWDGRTVASQLPFASATSYRPSRPAPRRCPPALAPGTRHQPSRWPQAPYTPWSFWTGPAGWKSPTLKTRPGAAMILPAPPRRATAARPRTGQALRCRGW